MAFTALSGSGLRPLPKRDAVRCRKIAYGLSEAFQKYGQGEAL